MRIFPFEAQVEQSRMFSIIPSIGFLRYTITGETEYTELLEHSKMKFLLIANFKSNKQEADVKEWLDEVAPHTVGSSAEIIVAPSFPHLSVLHSQITNNNYKIEIGSQNVSPFPPGSYTGEVNADQLKDLGVKYCIIGHSERRKYFGESAQSVANKANELLAKGITPILCMSETDIESQLAALDDSLYQKIIFAYEPPGDIGGTETAPLDSIKKVSDSIRDITSSRVIYGGSVNAGNIESLLTLNLDGVLVATACLKPSSFIDLINQIG